MDMQSIQTFLSTTATELAIKIFAALTFWIVGRWLIGAIGRRDYPVLQGGILISATLMIAINLLVDALYTAADPRLRR